MNEAIPVGVIGCGRMGKLHTRVYSQMPEAKLVGVYDAIAANAKAAAEQYNCKAFDSVDELIKEVRAVTIATPTEHHASAAERCLKAGVACLIEKPLARNVAECQSILDAAHVGGAVVQVGHVERFNPAIRAIAALNLKPLFIETVRVSPLTFRSIDVGVVLDVMIHDIDIVLSLAASRVTDVQATGVSVIGAAEDVCNARITFESGCVANMTASRLALKTERRMRLAARDCWVAVDYAKKQGVIARKSPNVQAIRETAAKVRSGEVADPTKLNFADMVQLEQIPVENRDQLTAEQEAFFNSIRSGSRPVVSGTDGLAAVELAQRIIDCMGQTGL